MYPIDYTVLKVNQTPKSPKGDLLIYRILPSPPGGIAVNLRSLRKELHGRSIKANGLKY